MKRNNESIVNILSAIENRAKGCETSKKTELEKIENLQTLFSKDINTLTIEDLSEQPLTKLYRIVKAIDVPSDYFKTIDLESETGRVKLFNSIQDFLNVINERLNNFDATIAKCSQYADLLTKKKLDKTFTDTNSFFNFISTLGVSGIDKVVAFRMLNEMNLETSKLDPEITQSTVYMYSYVEDYPDVKDAILDYIKDNKLKIKLDFVSLYAKEIAKTCNHSEALVNNVLLGMLLGQEYKKYEETESKKHLKNLKNMFGNQIEQKEVIIAEANRIISGEINKLRKVEYQSINDIVVTNAEDIDQFEFDKNRKKTMLAYMLKEQVEKYRYNTISAKDEEYKSIIMGIIGEYNYTDSLEFVPKAEEDVKSR